MLLLSRWEIYCGWMWWWVYTNMETWKSLCQLQKFKWNIHCFIIIFDSHLIKLFYVYRLTPHIWIELLIPHRLLRCSSRQTVNKFSPDHVKYYWFSWWYFLNGIFFHSSLGMTKHFAVDGTLKLWQLETFNKPCHVVENLKNEFVR